MKKYDLKEMYARYKNTPVDVIRKHLKTIRLVKKEHKGIGSVYGYYPLNQDSIDSICAKPRGVALNFFDSETENKPMNLKKIKDVDYLIKSSSRFFLKNDIGEVFDQIDEADLKQTKAICLNEGYIEVDNTNGEHFIMTVTLLK